MKEERRDDDEAVKKDKCSGEAGRHTRVTGFFLERESCLSLDMGCL
jgi:hypothetical protein